MEFFIALLFVSGPLRGVFEFLNITLVNPALLSAICILFLLIYKFFFQKQIHISKQGIMLASVLIGFWGLIAITSLFSISTEVFLFKSAISLLPVFAALVFCFLSEFDINRFFSWVIRQAVPICLIFLFYFPQWRLGLLDGENYNFEIIRTLYLGVGGLAAFSSMIVLLDQNKKSVLKKLLLLSLFFITLVISSARAPLIFLVLCLILAFGIRSIWAICKGYTGQWIAYSPIGLVVFLLVFFVFLSNLGGGALSVIEMSVERLLLLISADKGASVNTRLEYLDQAFKYIDAAPVFGSGVGSYGRLALKEELFMHPHNIFLESWFELGLPGLLLVIFLFGYSLYTGFFSGVLAVFLCLVFVWLNAMKSFSFAENRQLMILIGISFYMFQMRYARLKPDESGATHTPNEFNAKV